MRRARFEKVKQVGRMAETVPVSFEEKQDSEMICMMTLDALKAKGVDATPLDSPIRKNLQYKWHNRWQDNKWSTEGFTVKLNVSVDGTQNTVFFLCSEGLLTVGIEGYKYRELSLEYSDFDDNDARNVASYILDEIHQLKGKALPTREEQSIRGRDVYTEIIADIANRLSGIDAFDGGTDWYGNPKRNDKYWVKRDIEKKPSTYNFGDFKVYVDYDLSSWGETSDVSTDCVLHIQKKRKKEMSIMLVCVFDALVERASNVTLSVVSDGNVIKDFKGSYDEMKSDEKFSDSDAVAEYVTSLVKKFYGITERRHFRGSRFDEKVRAMQSPTNSRTKGTERSLSRMTQEEQVDASIARDMVLDQMKAKGINASIANTMDFDDYIRDFSMSGSGMSKTDFSLCVKDDDCACVVLFGCYDGEMLVTIVPTGIPAYNLDGATVIVPFLYEDFDEKDARDIASYIVDKMRSFYLDRNDAKKKIRRDMKARAGIDPYVKANLAALMANSELPDTQFKNTKCKGFVRDDSIEYEGAFDPEVRDYTEYLVYDFDIDDFGDTVAVTLTQDIGHSLFKYDKVSQPITIEVSKDELASSEADKWAEAHANYFGSLLDEYFGRYNFTGYFRDFPICPAFLKFKDLFSLKYAGHMKSDEEIERERGVA